MTEGTVLRLYNPASGPVRLDIIDARGSHVATLVDADLPAGSRTVAWGGKDDRGRPLPGGSYFARARTGGGTGSVKLTLVR
jgi:flagellar hook assembly protein FlgD